MQVQLDVVIYFCNTSTQEAEAEDHEASLGYSSKTCLKHSCNTSTQEAEAEDHEASLGYCSETLSKRGRGSSP